MKSVYPKYADRVDFYAVAVSSAFDNLERLENNRDKNGYPWPVAIAVNESRALADLNVSYQSTKVAFDSSGGNNLPGRVRRWRGGYLAPGVCGLGQPVAGALI